MPLAVHLHRRLYRYLSHEKGPPRPRRSKTDELLSFHLSGKGAPGPGGDRERYPAPVPRVPHLHDYLRRRANTAGLKAVTTGST